jgi:hypothetical protein
MGISATSPLTRKLAGAAGAVLAMASATVGAAGSASDWQFAAMIYGWLPSVGGDLKYGLPPGTGGAA